MTKQIAVSLLLLFSCCGLALANEYQDKTGSTHVVTVVKGWCGNLAMSTKVGHLVNGNCVYEKETQPYSYSGCIQYLHGGLLGMIVGKGYTCAATHIHSNAFGGDAYDAFNLIVNSDGQYISSDPLSGEVALPQ